MLRPAFAIIIIAALIGLLVGGLQRAFGFDKPEYQSLDPKIRDWFKSVRSKNGIPCCDIADGYRTDYDQKPDNHYWVPIAGEWRQVPTEAVVENAGNPTGEAIVRYVKQGENTYHIRCFVPGGGV